MPYKKGPDGTVRYYDFRTGRYAKDPDPSARLFVFKKKDRAIKMSEKQKAMDNKAMKAQDQGLYPLYCALTRMNPGCVKDVNKDVYKCGRKITELDIVTNKFIIEIKSGKPTHKMNQFNTQKKMAEKRGLGYIIYAPLMGTGLMRHCQRIGLKAVRTIPEILEEYNKK